MHVKDRAWLFDFDGTLVDTMPMHCAAYIKVFEAHGLTLSESHFYASIGGPAHQTIPLFLKGQKCELSTSELHRFKKEEINRVFERCEIPILPAMRILRHAVGQDTRVGIVTSGARAGVEILLVRLGLLKTLDILVCGEDVQHGKPWPEPYCLAMNKLGVAPQETLVFEDSDAGEKSALAAGALCIRVDRMTLPEVTSHGA